MRLAVDRHGILRKYRRGMKESAMVFAAIEAVANTDAVREPRSDYPNIAAQAAASELPHRTSPRETADSSTEQDKTLKAR